MRGARGRRGTKALAAAALLAVFPAGAAGADDESLVVSPVAIAPIKPVDPVPAADGLVHLAYELELTNYEREDVRIDRIVPRARGVPIEGTLEGEALAARLYLGRPGGDGVTLADGSAAIAFMDVTQARGQPRPTELTHRFDLTIDPGGERQRTLSYAGVPERVRASTPVEVEPPLHGDRWPAISGCCTLNPHRLGALPLNGTIHVPERFAIDFVQLDDEYRLFDGPVDQISSYDFYGTPVRAAAPGRVLIARDGQPDQTPGALPPNITVDAADGNYVVTTIDGRRKRFASYAHLVPGSVAVKQGEQVRAGEVIGRLGNSGNSDAPHLHFQVTSKPSLESNGLPFVFDRFEGQGKITDLGPLFAGEPTPVDPGALAGPHRRVLPLDNQLLDFGG